MDYRNKEELTDLVNLRLFNGNSLPLKLHEAAVSSDALTKLGVLNNSWVSIKMTKEMDDNVSRNNREDKPESILKLVSFEDLSINVNDFNFEIISSLNTGAVYVKGETAFNVCYDQISLFQSFMKGDNPPITVQPVNMLLYSQRQVTSATISVIRSPNVPLDNNYNESLKKYFSKMRHLTLNQIFKVDYNDSDSNHLDGSNHCLWFKVISLELENSMVRSGWIQEGKTLLYASNSTNSFVPMIRDQLACNLEPLTRGLNDYYTRIKDIAWPVIEQKIISSEAAVLLHGPAAVGKRLLVCYLQEQYCMHLYEVNCFNVIGESIAAVEQRIEAIFNKAVYCSPCVLLLRNIHAFSKYKDGDENEPRLVHCLSKCIKSVPSSSIVFVVATTNHFNELSTDICRCFMYEIEVEAPDEEARLQTLIGITQDLDVSECCFSSTAKRTAGMVLGDLRMLVSKAVSFMRSRMESCESHLVDAPVLESLDDQHDALENPDCHLRNSPGLESCDNQTCLIQADIDIALDKIHTEYKDTLGMPKIPDVSWSDVGGLADVKSEIMDTIKIPLLHPELTSKGLRRSGLLLYGPPGCGKTLLAKAVATEFSLNFFSVKGPELINMYVGQSEQNVRDMFKKARECAPCVVFFDELDSIAPNRGKSGDSGGVMDRVVSQLLAELDGMQTSNELFVIGATNRPDLLDNALLRPGRFDKLVYVGFPETKTDRINIIKSYTNKMNLDESVDVDDIEESLPLYLTGADFYALCSDSMLNAIRRRVEEIESGSSDAEDDLVVFNSDFKTAVKSLVPSVSTEDVLKYKEMKRKIDFEKYGTSVKSRQ